jgi:hypothetical protein
MRRIFGFVKVMIAKRIQAFSFDLFCSVLPGLGWLWENLEKGLDNT